MLRIEWDKKELETRIMSHSSYSIMDQWIPVFVYIDNIEISGLKNIPNGDITHLISFFPNLMSIFQEIDPEKFGKIEFMKGPRTGNLVEGGGFKFTVLLEKKTDVLTINYSNKGIREWQTITIPLKEFINGALYAANEIISDFQRIVPRESEDDEFLTTLKLYYNLIREWYEERYHESVEEKYVIPHEYL